jgi:hypothetical protein
VTSGLRIDEGLFSVCSADQELVRVFEDNLRDLGVSKPGTVAFTIQKKNIGQQVLSTQGASMNEKI